MKADSLRFKWDPHANKKFSIETKKKTSTDEMKSLEEYFDFIEQFTGSSGDKQTLSYETTFNYFNDSTDVNKKHEKYFVEKVEVTVCEAVKDTNNKWQATGNPLKKLDESYDPPPSPGE